MSESSKYQTQLRDSRFRFRHIFFHFSDFPFSWIINLIFPFQLFSDIFPFTKFSFHFLFWFINHKFQLEIIFFLHRRKSFLFINFTLFFEANLCMQLSALFLTFSLFSATFRSRPQLDRNFNMRRGRFFLLFFDIFSFDIFLFSFLRWITFWLHFSLAH